MGLSFTIIAIALFLLLESFFSGSEISLVVADKIKLKARAEAGESPAKIAMWFVKNPAQFFSTVILGTNFAVVSASTIATIYLISTYGEKAEGFALLLSPVVLIFGEVLPKSLFQHYANKLVVKVVPFLMAAMYVMYPFVWMLSKFTNFLLGGVTSHLGREPRITREELSLLIHSSESPDVKPSERKMVTKILELANQRVENVMVPLAHLEVVPVTSSKEAALAIFDLKGFSKLPVFENRSYNIIGVIDCLDCLFSEEGGIRELISDVMYVHEGMHLHELYLLMRDKQESMAVVVDEYGAAVGLVTLEDVLEEVVGEIKDEYEFGHQHFRKLGVNSYLVSGATEVEEANEKLGLEIQKGDYETVAGFLLERFGHIPEVGERFSYGKWIYIVTKATERAIIEVEVKGK